MLAPAEGRAEEADMAGFRGRGGAALVTGASAGIGLELARLLAARGMDLIVVARSVENLRILARQLAQQHRIKVIPVPVDLARPDAAVALPEAFRTVDLTVDLLVNNAGIGVYGAFGNQGIEREAEMIRLNTVAPALLAGMFLPGMIRRRHGRILNIASTAGFAPVPWLATYSATKAHLIAWTHALDVELRGTGVRASVCCPGTVATKFLEVSGAAALRANRFPEASAAQVAKECLRGLDHGRRVIVVGGLNRMHRLAAFLTPTSWATEIAGRVNRPKEEGRSARRPG
jgi:short-subunit dehydrogenase